MKKTALQKKKFIFPKSNKEISVNLAFRGNDKRGRCRRENCFVPSKKKSKNEVVEARNADQSRDFYSAFQLLVNKLCQDSTIHSWLPGFRNQQSFLTFTLKIVVFPVSKIKLNQISSRFHSHLFITRSFHSGSIM